MEQPEPPQQPSSHEAVAELKRREVQWQQIDELLRRIVARLCIAARGLDLTRVPNRAAYDQRLARDLQLYARDRRPRSFAVIDIDHFKSINDRFGHQAGDKVLRVLAWHLSRRLRECDFFGRYGGEEFVMVLDDTPLQQALQLGNRLRERVAQLGFHFRQQPITVTVSCGITAFRGDDTPRALFERADRALYEAKRSGRNRCCAEP